jgi:hypothetical protein
MSMKLRPPIWRWLMCEANLSVDEAMIAQQFAFYLLDQMEEAVRISPNLVGPLFEKVKDVKTMLYPPSKKREIIYSMEFLRSYRELKESMKKEDAQ